MFAKKKNDDAPEKELVPENGPVPEEKGLDGVEDPAIEIISLLIGKALLH